LNKDIIDEIILVKEIGAFAMCRRIAKKEGLMVGTSSVVASKVIEEIAKRKENT